MISSLRDVWFRIDFRSLAAMRIALGLVLLWDLFIRSFNLTAFYTTEGVLPNHFVLFSPTEPIFSYLLAFSAPWEVKTIFVLIALIFLAFTIGAGGIVVRILTLFSTASLSMRNLFVEHGGHLVLCLIATWCVLLPVDRYFSYASYKRRKEDPIPWFPIKGEAGSYESIACLGMLLSLATIYAFNAITKTGDTWHNGTAIHYALNLSQHTTHFGFWMRSWPTWILSAFSYSTWWMEALLPALILSPFLTRYTRLLAFLFIWMLHGGIGSTLRIGIFPSSLMAYAFCVLQTFHWKLIFKPSKERALITYGNILQNSFATLFIFILALQAWGEYSGFKNWEARYIPPAWTDVATKYLRIKQSWRMFAPDVPKKDYAVVIRGEKANGEFIDIQKGTALDIDNQNSLHRYFDEPQERDSYWVHWELRMLFLPFRSNPGFFHWFSEYIFKNNPDVIRFWVHHLERDTPAPGEKIKNKVVIHTLFDALRNGERKYVGP